LWRVHSDAVNKELLARWLADSSAKTVLKTDLFDEALSDGLYSMLASPARQVCGMDLSARIVRIAGSRHGDLQSIVANVGCLPFHDGTFDVIVSNSTLDHFKTQDEIVTSLRELHRVLRPSGSLLLTLDNPSNPVVALRQMLPFDVLNRLGVLPYYVGATVGPNHLRRILHQLRFEVTEMGAVLHCPRMPAVALCRLLAKHGTWRMQRRFLHLMMAFEGLSRWPTRLLTGHFVAVRAMKR
jgi:SAM-dependent methyltransferase